MIGDIETKRLTLSAIRVADAPEMSRVLGDSTLYEFTGGAAESAAALTARYTRWVAGATKLGQTWVNLVVRERASGDAVGYVQATIHPESADIAWVIGTPWQRRGYATEAAHALVDYIARAFAVRTVRAMIRPDHTASQVIALRLHLQRTRDEIDGEDVWVGSARRDGDPPRSG